jgi:putative membrane protein
MNWSEEIAPMIRSLTLAALAAALIPAVARAQVAAPRTSPTQDTGIARVSATPSAVSDELFAAAASSGGLAEVNISKIGLERATDPELKRFSQQMVQDHTQMNRELLDLVAHKGIRVPQVIDARAQFCAESLAGLSGAEFDKCYAKAQMVMHMDAVAMFKAEAERGQDPQIKALAARALPKIEEHLHMIKPIAMRYEKEKQERQAAHSGRQGQ